MNKVIKILLVEDVATDAELTIRQLRRDGLVVEAQRVKTRDAFIAGLKVFKPDLILSDYSLPEFDGLSALLIAHDACPDIPFLFLSGTIGEETAIHALKAGAIDYVLKTSLSRLGAAVRRALDEAHMRLAHRQAESRFRDLIEFAPHAIVVTNDRGRIEIVNAQAESLFGYRRDEVVGMLSERLIPGCLRQWHEALQGRDPAAPDSGTTALTFEAIGRSKNGGEFSAEVSLSPLKTEAGLWISGVVRDISERKEQENRLVRLSRLHTVLSGINTAIVRIHDRQKFLEKICRIAVEDGLFAAAWIGMLDRDTLRLTPQAWVGVERDYLDRFGLSADERLPEGRGPTGVALRNRTGAVAHDTLDLQMGPWRTLLVDRGYRSTCTIPLLAGSETIGALILYATQAGVFNEEERRLLSMVAADISFALNHFNQEEQINYLAYFDSVTGLPNRALFKDRVTQLIESCGAKHGGKIVLVLLDLDRFRNINEAFGRSATDELLREVARRLRSVVPEPGCLARIHADCFAFAMQETGNETDIISLLERSVAVRLSAPITALGKDIRTSATAGIVLYPTDGTDIDILLRNGEAALKNAKAIKARYLFYTSEMNARTAEKLSIENRLRRALEQEQFVLYYQPKIDLASNRIIGLEALIRWNDPEYGLIQPEKFIHVLEETGLIVEVGKWVIHRARRQYYEWAARGIEAPRIALNVSQLQIRQKDFVRHTIHLLGEHEPGNFELEITESLFMQGADQDAAKMKLAALRETGITMAIDDFGTGYSSLSYIAHLPIDTLKIDRSFIRDMTTSQEHMAIVSTIILLARSLNFKVVAEGVETHRQARLLKALGCDHIQGFLYSRTLPPWEIEEKLVLQQAM